METVERSEAVRGCGRAWGEQGEARGCKGSDASLHDTVLGSPCLHTRVQTPGTHTPERERSVNWTFPNNVAAPAHQL